MRFLSLLLLTMCFSLVFAADSAVPERILWEDGVQNAYPRWSNDGARILYQSNRSGKWQLHVMNRDGSGDRAVMVDEFNNNFPDWSPDNERIAFVSDRDGNEDIYVIAADGTKLRRLTNHPQRDIHPYWAPDGKSLLFNSNRDDLQSFDVYSINVDGTGETRFTDTPEVETCARYSADGSKIVMLRGADNDDVFICDPSFQEWVNLTKSSYAEGWPAWSPEGKEIVYSHDQSGTFALYLMDTTGLTHTRLTFPQLSERDARAHFSPDGAYLVFNRQSGPTIGIYILNL